MNIKINYLTQATIVRLFFFAVFCIGCKSDHKPIDLKNVTKLNLSFVIDLDKDTNYLKPIRTIRLETKQYQTFIEDIERIYFDDEKYFILDKSLGKISIFDTQGKFVNAITRLGRGPSEYISVMDFTLDTEKNLIYILCDRPYKIMALDYGGNFIKEVTINGLYYEISMDKEFVYLSKADTESDRLNKNSIAVLNKDLELISEELPNTGRRHNSVDIFGNSFSSTNSGIYFGKRFNFNIYQISGGKVKPRYQVDFGEHALPDKLFDANPNFLNEVDKHNYFFGIKDIVESKTRLLFQSNNTMFFYEKGKDSFLGINTLRNTPYAVSLSHYLTLGNTNQIVFSTSPASIKRLLALGKEKGFDLDPDFVTLANSISENDNQILFIYELKN